MPNENVQVRNVVNDAVAEVNKEVEKTPEPAPKKASKSEPPKGEDDFSTEDLTNAKVLYKALKDGGETAGAVIDALATRNGYQRIETKAEAKEAKVEIKDELLEALGEDYPDLVKKLGPAIDKYVDRKLKESTEDIRTSIQQGSQEKLESRSEATFTELSNEFYEGKGVPKEIDESMAKLMDRYKPEPGQEIEEYVKDMFHLATSKAGKAPASKAARTAAAAARNNAPSRLDSSSGRPIPADTTNTRTSSVQSKPMTLDQAVRLAIQQVNSEMES